MMQLQYKMYLIETEMRYTLLLHCIRRTSLSFRHNNH